MPYRFALDRPDYSDLASGKVLLGAPGHPAFPVRLASEIFQRCLEVRRACGLTGRIVLFDPCCGAAYHLAVLGLLHGESLRAILAADIDPEVIPLAERNLAMLSASGLERRRAELAELHRRFGKESHREGLAAAENLRRRLEPSEMHPLEVHVFQADALEKPDIARFPFGGPVEIVFTDVPYGRHSQWRSPSAERENPIRLMLDNILVLLHPNSLVAIASDKRQKASHDRYDRIERFHFGKRMAVIWRPKS